MVEGQCMSKNDWLSVPFDFFQPLMPYLVNFGLFSGCFLAHENCLFRIINDLYLFFIKYLITSFVNIFKKLMKMSELNQLFVLLSQEEFLLISENQQNLELFISIMLVISKAFFEITVPKWNHKEKKVNSTI